MPNLMPQKSVALTSDEQVGAFEAAKAAIDTDEENDNVDADRYRGNIADGEAVRVLAEAYTGQVDFGDYNPEDGDKLVAIPADELPEAAEPAFAADD